jgi:hypothetical protein
MIRSFPPHLYPVEYFVLLHGASPLPPRGEGRPFIPPAELGGILEYFDKSQSPKFETKSIYPVVA